MTGTCIHPQKRRSGVLKDSFSRRFLHDMCLFSQFSPIAGLISSINPCFGGHVSTCVDFWHECQVQCGPSSTVLWNLSLITIQMQRCSRGKAVIRVFLYKVQVLQVSRRISRKFRKPECLYKYLFVPANC